jgi:hypothetical protein
MKSNKKKITKYKKNNNNNNNNNANKIPYNYVRYYNSILTIIKKFNNNNEFKNINLTALNIENNDDNLFPYKFYINLYNTEDSNINNIIMTFEIFLSNILCRYTIRLIHIENNTKYNESYKKIKGFNKTDGILNEIISQYKLLVITNK